MCRFCVEHGEGERWYLQAKNYAYDLDSDLKRRGYVVDFIRGFPQMRTTAVNWLDHLDRMPVPISDLTKRAISAYQQKHHFGQPVPIEECEQIFEMATSITVIPCICRMHASDAHPQEVCVVVTTKPIDAVLAEGFADYTNGPDLSDFRRVDKAEAMELLRTCEQQGLLHSIWTFETPFTAAICNCDLDSGCMAMRLTAGHGLKVMWRGEWVARLDADTCTNCGRCEKQCPFGAITRDCGRTHIRTEQCWGCGVCRAVCRSASLTLADRRDVPEVAQLW